MVEETSGSELLDRAEQAHRSGRFAQMRQLLQRLHDLAARGVLSVAEQQRAQALWARLRPDPLVAGLVLACLLLFVSVVGSTWH